MLMDKNFRSRTNDHVTSPSSIVSLTLGWDGPDIISNLKFSPLLMQCISYDVTKPPDSFFRTCFQRMVGLA